MADDNKTGKSKAKGVGYRNPPEGTRFKKGSSGNPKGRPKGALNFATVLDRTLREKVIVNENGQRKVVTKLEAAIKQLVNQSASGSLSALRHLLALVALAEERVAEAPESDAALSEVDEKVLQEILEQFGKGNGGEDDENNE